MKSYDAYLFDCDGTLIDTTEMICRCFAYTCKRFAGITVSRDAVIAHIGIPLRGQLEYLLGPLSEEKAAAIIDAHMTFQLAIYTDHLRLFPYVKETLGALKQAGKKCAVVTSRRQYTLNLFLAHTGVLDFFDLLVTPEMTEKHKPDPEPALEALRRLSCPASKALFVGDAVFDIQCGAAAGTDTAFVAWSATSAPVSPVRPTCIINDMRELL